MYQRGFYLLLGASMGALASGANLFWVLGFFCFAVLAGGAAMNSDRDRPAQTWPAA